MLPRFCERGPLCAGPNHPRKHTKSWDSHDRFRLRLYRRLRLHLGPNGMDRYVILPRVRFALPVSTQRSRRKSFDRKTDSHFPNLLPNLSPSFANDWTDLRFCN